MELGAGSPSWHVGILKTLTTVSSLASCKTGLAVDRKQLKATACSRHQVAPPHKGNRRSSPGAGVRSGGWGEGVGMWSFLLVSLHCRPCGLLGASFSTWGSCCCFPAPSSDLQPWLELSDEPDRITQLPLAVLDAEAKCAGAATVHETVELTCSEQGQLKARTHRPAGQGSAEQKSWHSLLWASDCMLRGKMLCPEKC